MPMNNAVAPSFAHALALPATMYTAAQKLKNYVMLRALSWENGLYPLFKAWGENPSPGELDAVYAKALDQFPDAMQAAQNKCRCGTEETNLPTPTNASGLTYSRAGTSVAACMPDGSWVGWTYWQESSRHAPLEKIDWIEDAYDLYVKEEERIVVVRVLLKKAPTAMH